MPDTDNTPDLTKLAGARDARTDEADTGEPHNFAVNAMNRLTVPINRHPEWLRDRVDPIPLITLPRAISEAEARSWAHINLKKALMDGAGKPKSDLERHVAEMWKRLPRARDPKVALSYQRMIHQMTIFLGWIDWQEGEALLKHVQKVAEQDVERKREQQALAPWMGVRARRDPDEGDVKRATAGEPIEVRIAQVDDAERR